MSMTDSTPVQWKVISQVPQKILTATGSYVDGVRVTAQIANTGTTFYVDIPSSTYSVDVVKADLAAKAAQVGAVDGLTS